MTKKSYIRTSTLVNGFEISSNYEKRSTKVANQILEKLAEAGAKIKTDDLVGKETIAVLNQGVTEIKVSITDAEETDRMNEALSNNQEPITKSWETR
ncbi:hypothetical protein IWT25_00682 [Secundilactobacillus pentosiphilus]|uniref:Uncharacterized protein n=1 Tax=Secundilactobacillus pentosiphilus TaxID=1714682 RepID=A0A1Z5IUT9_9LACO|nr:hypothetical protein [Secundilactobacillus pentosiphilus]GAX05378.1 hypothetical protein IWT25_00682 [Secundilactobacillus pentosiphilus]